MFLAFFDRTDVAWRAQPGGMIQSPDLSGRQSLVAAAAHLSRQRNRAVGGADESTDFIADRLPETPDLTIAPFLKRDIKPAIRTVTTCRLNGVEMFRAIGQVDACLMPL